MTILRVAGACVFGSLVGSFLNVVIYRVPRGESIVRPGSRCPSCGRTLRAFENVPILSWVALRGRCRSCGVPISARYPLVETANALLWILCVIRFGNIELASFAAASCSVLLALAAIDLEHRR